jgi:hypothetical protein
LNSPKLSVFTTGILHEAPLSINVGIKNERQNCEIGIVLGEGICGRRRGMKVRK